MVRDRGEAERPDQSREGIALFAALALMAVIGLLVAGAVSTYGAAQRSARMVQTDAVLTSSADYALSTLLSNAAGFGLADLPLGQPASFDVPVPAAGVAVTVSATRLRGEVLWLVSDAVAGSGEGGHRRFNQIARFPFPGGLPRAALTARGDVRVSPDVAFLRESGADADCEAAPAGDVIMAPGAAAVRAPLGGDPLRFIVEAGASDSATYYLSARQVAALDSGRQVVHVRGDTTISGGSFEGVLLIDGAVAIIGPFRATGVIVAGGSITAVAGAFSLTGALLSYAPLGVGPAVEMSGATLVYSPCAVSRAFRQASPPRPVGKRGWAELF